LFMGEVTDGSVDVLRAEVAMLENVGWRSVLCCASTCSFMVANMMFKRLMPNVALWTVMQGNALHNLFIPQDSIRRLWGVH